jgi:FAD/FMN-containing dehydrogenase
MVTAQLREELRTLLGPEGLLTDPAAISPLLTDHHQRYHGRALAVALPRSFQEVGAVVRWCNQRRIGLVPQGGNTGYCGGATPDESGQQLVLLMRRMNRVRRIEPEDFSMTVEAGCVLADVQQAAAGAGRLFPLSLGSEGSCQIGGNLATNAGGVHVLRYGMTRQLVLGIEAVLGDGSELHALRSLHKDNTGYDLKSLLIGSEGTLGVITAATLALWPQPRASATAFVAIARPEEALALLELLRSGCGERLSSFELIPRIAVELTVRHVPGVTDPLGSSYPWYVLCELTSPGDEPLTEQLQELLARAAERSLVRDAALATSERVRAAFWRLRETVPEAQRRAGFNIRHDISVPVARLPQFIAEAAGWIAQHLPESRLVCYGHAGDGNLHFNLLYEAAATDTAAAAAFRAREPQVHRAIHDLVVRFEGSISAEHGIGRAKRDELAHYAPPATLAAMRAIKRALDPNGIMNPGKLL